MTHFRPICLMPLSSTNNAERIVSVPPLRQKNVKRDILKIYKPIKTKFRKKLTSVRRRSAFVIFQAIKPLLNASKLLTNDNTKITIKKPLVANSDVRQDTNTLYETDASAETNDSNGSRTQNNKKTVQTRKMSKYCDSMKNTRSNREKLLQEKEDFQLAKMLQECVGTTDTPSRYSLRSRNKSTVSSITSTSSQDLFGSKHFSVGVTPKHKKNLTCSDTAKELVNRSQRNVDPNDKCIDFSFQKLTRSRRIAMTMTGV